MKFALQHADSVLSVPLSLSFSCALSAACLHDLVILRELFEPSFDRPGAGFSCEDFGHGRVHASWLN